MYVPKLYWIFYKISSFGSHVKATKIIEYSPIRAQDMSGKTKIYNHCTGRARNQPKHYSP